MQISTEDAVQFGAKMRKFIDGEMRGGESSRDEILKTIRVSLCDLTVSPEKVSFLILLDALRQLSPTYRTILSMAIFGKNAHTLFLDSTLQDPRLSPLFAG